MAKITTQRICEYGWDEDANVRGCPKMATRTLKAKAGDGMVRTTHLCAEHDRLVLAAMRKQGREHEIIEHIKHELPTIYNGRTEGFY